jgi:hypothetical protein
MVFFMLTLNQLILFYFLISSDSEPFKKGIKIWASHVKNLPSNPQASRPASKSGSRTGSSKTTTKSTLVDSVVISTAGRDRSPSPTFGLFQDEDEIVGMECDAAASSPIKGRGRLTSSVNSFYFIFAYRSDILIYNRKLLRLRIPRNSTCVACRSQVDNCWSPHWMQQK